MAKQNSNKPVGSFIRWQTLSINHLTYSINLILILSIALLGYASNALANIDFSQNCFSRVFLDLGLLNLILSLVTGIWANLNRLTDFRVTAQIARRRELGESVDDLDNSRDLSRQRGHRTWLLFRLQVGLFLLAFLCLLFSFVNQYKEKIF